MYIIYRTQLGRVIARKCSESDKLSAKEAMENLVKYPDSFEFLYLPSENALINVKAIVELKFVDDEEFKEKYEKLYWKDNYLGGRIDEHPGSGVWHHRGQEVLSRSGSGLAPMTTTQGSV
jgi:hypothetical protein